MPIRFSDLTRETKRAALDVDGLTLHFAFRHHLLTPAFMHTLYALEAASTASAAAQEDAIMSACEQVARLLTEWDMVEDDGVTMIPLTVERLRHFPLLLQLRILNQCLAEMQPGESSAPGVNGSVSKPPSGATSSPRGRSARNTSRNGTHS